MAWQFRIEDPDAWGRRLPEARFRKWHAWWCVENEAPSKTE